MLYKKVSLEVNKGQNRGNSQKISPKSRDRCPGAQIPWDSNPIAHPCLICLSLLVAMGTSLLIAVLSAYMSLKTI